MRWVEDGPDIPVEIVQAVDEGRVVFFCGAGVSQQSGLPSFKGLVEAVYKKLHRRRESFPAEEKAFRDQNYDQAFASLEAAIKEPGLIRFMAYIVALGGVSHEAASGTAAVSGITATVSQSQNAGVYAAASRSPPVPGGHSSRASVSASPVPGRRG
jgi:hypothetical protein